MVSITAIDSNRECGSISSTLASYVPSGQTLKKTFVGLLALSGTGLGAARPFNRATNDLIMMRSPIGSSVEPYPVPPVDLNKISAWQSRHGESEQSVLDYDFSGKVSENEFDRTPENEIVMRRTLAEEPQKEISIGDSITQRITNDTQFHFSVSELTPVRFTLTSQNLISPWPFALSRVGIEDPKIMLFSNKSKPYIESLSTVLFPDKYYIYFGEAPDGRKGISGSQNFKTEKISKSLAYAEAGNVGREMWGPAIEFNDIVPLNLPPAKKVSGDLKYGVACLRAQVCGEEREFALSLFGTRANTNDLLFTHDSRTTQVSSLEKLPGATASLTTYRLFAKMPPGIRSFCIHNMDSSIRKTLSVKLGSESNKDDSCPVFASNPTAEQGDGAGKASGKSKGKTSGLIAGGVVGSVVALGGIIFTGIKYCRKPPKNDNQNFPSSKTNTDGRANNRISKLEVPEDRVQDPDF